MQTIINQGKPLNSLRKTNNFKLQLCYNKDPKVTTVKKRKHHFFLVFKINLTVQ